MTTHPQAVREDGRRAGQDEHIGVLVAQLSSDVSRLVRDELLGKRHVTHATPPVRRQAVDGVHEDLGALKGHQPERKAGA